MTDTHESGRRVAVLDALLGRVQSAYLRARAELNTAMRTKERVVVDSPNGVKLAEITKAQGRTSARVSDTAAFLAWVEEHCPDEVIVQRSVRLSFANAVVAASKKAGQPCAPDGTLDVPGITVTTGEPTLQLRTTPEAAAEIERMVADGQVELRSVLRELGAADD